MQYAPDGTAISTQTVYVGPPLRAPEPVEATPTVTVIEPITRGPTTEVVTGNVIVDPPPYSVDISEEGTVVISRVTNINFVGPAVTVTGNNSNATVSISFTETVYNAGGINGTFAPDYQNGTIQKCALVGNFTLGIPLNMAAGQSLTLILTQDGAGSRLMNPNPAYLFASGFATLSTEAGAIDMMNIFFDGTAYYTTLTVGYA